MSVYERKAYSHREEIRFRNYQTRIKALKEKCSFCEAVGSEDEPLLELRGSDDIVYKTCVSCEQEARDFCKPADKTESPFLPRGYYRI